MPRKKKLLLLVEDDKPTAKALCKILKMHGFDCTAVETVFNALLALNTEPQFEFVVLDIMLPDGEGTTVLRRIREIQYPAKVIVTSGTSDPTRIATIDALKPDHYFKKPIDVDVLLPVLV